MAKKRNPAKYGIYRIAGSHSVFLNNFDAASMAHHVASCLQAPAPPDITYRVDPPFGPLAPVKREQRLWSAMKKMLKGSENEEAAENER